MLRVARAWLTLALAALGCGSDWDPMSSPPSVLLVTLDTTRPDHLSVYGYERRTTPTLERLATEAVVFDLPP